MNKINRSKIGKRSRTKGHDFERQIAKELRGIGFKKAITSRAGDRSKDKEGIDILRLDAPLRIQCKCHNVFKNPCPTLQVMPQDNGYYNIVLMKVSHQGEYAILTKEDFFALLEILKTEQIL